MLSFVFSFFMLFFGLFNCLEWWITLTLMLGGYPFFHFLSINLSVFSKNSFICLDFFSFLMIILSFWIVFLSIISSLKILNSSSVKLFMIFFFVLFLFLFMFFIVSNFFFFFFFFESSLIPTLFIIMGWGNKVERIKSGYYLFFYTLFGSMPMLLSIFFLKKINFSLVFSFFEILGVYYMIYVFLVFSLLIKMPMFLVHSWLPKAHVEAPLSGSMILAGVLLKLGGYGLFRLNGLYKMFLDLNSIWIYISLWGGIMSSFICLRQIDLKSIIAFSSVSHMSLVIMGLFSFSYTSLIGSLMLMFGHGMCSSGLFFLSNVLYERSGSRSIFLNKGLMSIFPSLSFWWFLFCSFNMACPPSLNLVSEIFLFNGLVSWSFIFVFFLMFLSFLGGVYNLFLFSFCNHGSVYSSIFFFNSCYFIEYYILYLHFFPIFFFFLKLEFFY